MMPSEEGIAIMKPPLHHLPESRTPIQELHDFKVIVIASSAGGIHALIEILSSLPASLPVPIAIVQHRTAKLPYLLADILGRRTSLNVNLAVEGEQIKPGNVYLALPDKHLTINPDHTLSFTDGKRIRHLLSSANPLFTSAADVYGDGTIAVVLTGGDSDATDGVQAVKAAGGTVIAQDEATSDYFSMPRSAIKTGCVDYVLPLGEIASMLLSLLKGSPDNR
jgi:two-component system chemotaxis response regulator CheB